MDQRTATFPARDRDDSAQLPTLRILTCGSVDDGKSTLIGRILFDLGVAPDDQLVALERDSRKFGMTGEDLDLALLIDGLESEQQQGIAIDVAYRYFSTERRSFIIADTPGHDQYTRNMATGAANCDLAILLIDARKGILEQTLRHMWIVSMLGIRHVVLAVNKMDLVDYSEAVFNAIVTDFACHASGMGFRTLVSIPMSALFGVNVTARSTYVPWHHGPCLVDYLETIDVADDAAEAALRFQIQRVNPPDLDFHGMSGAVMSGRVRVGDEIAIADTGLTTRVARIVSKDVDLESAKANDAVTLVFAEKIDASRGDLICHVADRPALVEQFAAHLFWMGAEKLLPGRIYLIKINGRTAPASVTEIKHRLNIWNQQKMAAKTLGTNEVGFCNVTASRALCIDSFERYRKTGAFLLLDRTTNATVAIGTIAFPLRRASNVHLQRMSVTKEVRAGLKYQKPGALWFTGLSGSGKSTVANLVEIKLAAQRAHTIIARRRQSAPRPQPRPRLHRRRPRREYPPRRRSVEADGRGRPDRAVLLHLAIRGRAPDGARNASARRIRRDLPGYPNRIMYPARPEGALQKGARGRNKEFHWRRPTLRASGKCRDRSQAKRWHSRGNG